MYVFIIILDLTVKLHSMVNYFNSKCKLKFALNFITQSLGPFVLFFFLNNCLFLKTIIRYFVTQGGGGVGWRLGLL